MVSLQKAQTGKRVYGGVSQSPNRGQVSAAGAQGYIQREVAKKNQAGVVRPKGGDGKSDSRSTVAAQALNRQPGLGTGSNNILSDKLKQGKGSKAGGQALGAGGGSGGARPSLPTITIQPDGVLQLPYDQASAEDEFQATDQANQNLLSLQMQEGEHNAEYAQNKRDSELAYNDMQRYTLNDNSGRGVLFSTAYTTAAERDAGDYTRQMSDLENAHSRFLSNLNFRRGAVQNSLRGQLGLIGLRRAQMAAQQAAALAAQQAAMAPPPAAVSGPNPFNPSGGWGGLAMNNKKGKKK